MAKKEALTEDQTVTGAAKEDNQEALDKNEVQKLRDEFYGELKKVKDDIKELKRQAKF